MTKNEREAFEELVRDLRISVRVPYSSDPSYEEGIDMGREHAADEIETLLNRFVGEKK